MNLIYSILFFFLSFSQIIQKPKYSMYYVVSPGLNPLSSLVRNQRVIFVLFQRSQQSLYYLVGYLHGGCINPKHHPQLYFLIDQTFY